MNRSKHFGGTLAKSKATGITGVQDSGGAALQANQQAAIAKALSDLTEGYIVQKLGPLSSRPNDVHVKGVQADMATLHLEKDGKNFAFEVIVGILLEIQRRNLLHQGGMVWQPRLVPAIARGKLNGVAHVKSVDPYPGALASFEPWVQHVSAHTLSAERANSEDETSEYSI